ncbi:MAG: hypothetical protein GY833_12395 [Aestuariibacter sp.]|nr:hypothetical protein [Aestuariibacter sp.]
MPLGFTKTADRLSDYGKVRDHLEPSSTLPSSDTLASTLEAQLAALAQPTAATNNTTNTASDSIADDLAELVAQLRAMSFARNDVGDVADNAFNQTPALTKLADGLSLTKEEMADSANALNTLAGQLSDIQAAKPITVGDLTDGYLQAIENATSTKQQAVLLKQLASLGDHTAADADDMAVIRKLAEQEARINVHQTKQLGNIVELLRSSASENGTLSRGVHEVLSVNQDQLTHNRLVHDEQNKQRDFDLREAEKEKSKEDREKKAKENEEKKANSKQKRNSKGQFGKDDPEKGGTSFLTKIMTGDIAGLREEALGAVLGTVGFEGAAAEVSSFIEERGERRAEKQEEAARLGTSNKASSKDGKGDQRPDADFEDEPNEKEKGMLRDFGSRAFSHIRSEVVSAALGSIGFEGAAEEVDKYLEDKKQRHAEQKEEKQEVLALPAPKRAPLKDRLLGAFKQNSADVETEVPRLPSAGSKVTSTAHIDGLNAGQSKTTELDLFAPKDRTQEKTLDALETIAANSAKSAQDAANAAKSVTNNSNVTNITNTDNRRSVSGSKSIANYNNTGSTLALPDQPRTSRRSTSPVLALPAPAETRRTSIGSQRKVKGQLSSTTASIAVGKTDRKNDLMAHPTPQQSKKQQRQAKRDGNSAVSKKAETLSPMMQVATNPLAGKDGEALVGSTLKLNKEEMDVIDQEMILIKDMRKTLKRVEGALPDESLLGGLLGGGGGIGDLLGAGDLFDDFLGGRKNRRRDRVGNQDIESGRRGRRGGTRGGRVRSALGNMASTAKAAISGAATGMVNLATGGEGGGLLDMAGDFLDFGGSDRDRSRGSGRRKGGLGSRIGGAVSGAFSKGKGFLGNIASKGAGLLGGAGGVGGALSKGKGFLGNIASKGAGLLGGAGGLLGGVGGGIASVAGGASGLLKGAGSLAKGVLGKVPLLAPLMAAYDGFNGWNNAGSNFGLEEGQEATTGQKMSSALGGIVSGLSFGLLDEGSVSRGIHSAGSMLGDVGNSLMNRMTFGLWGGDDDEEEAKSAAAKIAGTSSDALAPNADELVDDALPSLATSGALAGTAAMTGLSLAKDDSKELDLFKPRDRVNKQTGSSSAIASQAAKSLATSVGKSSNNESSSLLSKASSIASTAASYTPLGLAASGVSSLLGLGSASDDDEKPSLLSRMSDAASTAMSYTPIGMAATGASSLFSSDASGSVPLSAKEEKTPSMFDRLKDAASTAVSYTPMGLAYKGVSSLVSDGSTGAAATPSGKASEPSSMFDRLKDAASTAVSYTPMGLAYKGVSSLVSDGNTGAAATPSGKVSESPSMFDRLKDAASTAVSYTPMGLAYKGVSSLVSDGNTGSINLHGKTADSPSLLSRVGGAIGTAASYTPMGLAYNAWSSMFGSESKPSSSSIASKDGTFFNPSLAEGGSADQLFMGDGYTAKGGLSSAATIVGRAPDLSNRSTGDSQLDAHLQNARNVINKTFGLSNDGSSVSKVSNLASYSNLTNIGGSTSSKSNVSSRAFSTGAIGSLLSQGNTAMGGTLAGAATVATAGGQLNAHVEMPPTLRDEKLMNDTLMSPTVQAQLSGAATGGQGKRPDRNNPNVVSASRPKAQRRTTVSSPRPSSSGHAGSFNVDDTGIAIMNSILFD